MFSSNKLLKLKYIHLYFFLKFLTKKSRCVLWAGKYVKAEREDCNCITGFIRIDFMMGSLWMVFKSVRTRFRLKCCEDFCFGVPCYGKSSVAFGHQPFGIIYWFILPGCHDLWSHSTIKPNKGQFIFGSMNSREFCNHLRKYHLL